MEKVSSNKKMSDINFQEFLINFAPHLGGNLVFPVVKVSSTLAPLGPGGP